MIYTVKIKFNSFDKFILDNSNKEIEISINSRPVNGKANKEAIKKIADFFKIKSTNVKIIQGLRSTTKKIDITL